MSLFHHTNLSFAPIDPLGDGLNDEIASERSEPEHFELYDQLDERLADQWEEILADERRDPSVNFVTDH